MGQDPATGASADSLRCGIFAVDDDGVIQAWNGGAADLLGWREDLAVGRRLGEVLAPLAFRGVEAAERPIAPLSDQENPMPAPVRQRTSATR